MSAPNDDFGEALVRAALGGERGAEIAAELARHGLVVVAAEEYERLVPESGRYRRLAALVEDGGEPGA